MYRISKPKPARYRTTNWSSYNASLRKRGAVLIWVDKDMTWLAPHEERRGRPAVFSDAAIQFCLSINILFKLPLRQTAGMVASLLKLAGLDWSVPDFFTLCCRQKSLAVQVPYRRADGPLNLLVDSTGFKFLGDGEWQARKHGIRGRRQWHKVHLAMDPATSDIRAVEFTPSCDGDSPVLPDLLRQIPKSEPIGTVTADGAYDTRRCHTAIIECDAVPIIPIRKNGRLWKDDCSAAPPRSSAWPDVSGERGSHASGRDIVTTQIATLLAAFADHNLEDGRARLVRHGHLPEREVLTGVGPVAVKVPRVSDRKPGEDRITFTPSTVNNNRQNRRRSSRGGNQTGDQLSNWRRDARPTRSSVFEKTMKRSGPSEQFRHPTSLFSTTRVECKIYSDSN
jgi:hypothetical protein